MRAARNLLCKAENYPKVNYFIASNKLSLNILIKGCIKSLLLIDACVWLIDQILVSTKHRVLWFKKFDGM